MPDRDRPLRRRLRIPTTAVVLWATFALIVASCGGGDEAAELDLSPLAAEGRSLADGPAVILLLMLASALSGFLFIRQELARTFLAILDHAKSGPSGVDVTAEIRAASKDEIRRISDAIDRITQRLDPESPEAAPAKEQVGSGIA